MNTKLFIGIYGIIFALCLYYLPEYTDFMVSVLESSYKIYMENSSTASITTGS